MSNHASASSRSLSQIAGFTLAELLIVLVVLGLVAAIVGPRFVGSPDADAYAREMASVLRNARSYAVEQGSDILVTFDVDARQVRLVDRPAMTWPEDVRLSINASAPAFADGSVGVRFGAQGGSSGLQILLSSSDQRTDRLLSVSWLTGEIRISRLAP